jgi:hypothetical protein
MMHAEVFGNNALGLPLTYEWFQHFKKGWMSVDSNEHFGQTIHDVCVTVKLVHGMSQSMSSICSKMCDVEAKKWPNGTLFFSPFYSSAETLSSNRCHYNQSLHQAVLKNISHNIHLGLCKI